MPTTKKRLNITLPGDIEKALSKSAAEHGVPQATKAAELLRLALEIEEDETLELLAKKRDSKKARYYEHKKVWR